MKAAAAARQAKLDKQAALEKKMMSERRAGFNKKFANTWSTGPTGISKFQFVIGEKGRAETIIHELFNDRLIADVEVFENPIKRTYLQNGTVNWQGGDFRVTGVTTDDKVADLISTVVKFDEPNIYPSTDIMVSSIATGSKDYILWVKDATCDFINHDAEEFESHNASDPGPNTGVSTNGTDTTSTSTTTTTTTATTTAATTTTTDSATTTATSADSAATAATATAGLA